MTGFLESLIILIISGIGIYFFVLMFAIWYYYDDYLEWKYKSEKIDTKD